MGKLKTGSKIFLLCIINPHRFALALILVAAHGMWWLIGKMDDATQSVVNAVEGLQAKWPVIGERIAKSIANDYQPDTEEDD
ncbi:hypothetical protein [Enterobacter sp. R1(2018)]|uniref:hypothetical protein n=1 Tax=Enterobacter sp. R1(2018) TaxID=2447891 RepID=UPI000EB093DA|nr:hypothetical protein [Enterobacter sp. R1(2018)]RKQ38374.1 hypothetical protein D8M09_17365 [Enterobacter sp. R1(2018)]